MREYGKVYTAFWTSEDARGMSEDGRILALYLMTCPHGNMLGCFRLTDAYAADDLQWDAKRVRKGFEELFKKGFSYRCEKTFWVLIRHYLKWNQFENPNVGLAAGKLFESISAPNLVKGALCLALREFAPRFPAQILDAFEGSSEPFANPFEQCSKTRALARARTVTRTKPEPEPQKEPEQTLVDRREAPLDHDPVPGIFAYWQRVMNSPNSQLDTKRIDVIRKALGMGYTPRQLCEAVKGCSRSPHNMGQNDRNTKYNSIGLIFRNADNIDRFIELASGQATAGSGETIEQRNNRIFAELAAQVSDDQNTIDMEDA